MGFAGVQVACVLLPPSLPSPVLSSSPRLRAPAPLALHLLLTFVIGPPGVN